MSSLFSVSGLSSGIDTKSLIEQLINLDRAPARLAETNKATVQTRLDAIKAMNTRILAVSDALDLVKTASSFSAKQVSSSDEAVLTASVSTTAIAGSMRISVKQLATTHQVTTLGQASATETIAAGSLAFRLASTPDGSPDLVVTPTTNTMTGLAEAINAANLGIVASVINDGSDTPYRLVISSSKSGEANAITDLVGTGGFSALVPDLSQMEVLAEAQNAEVRLGDSETGLLLTSASNTLDQAIPGVTLNLKSVADNIDVTVSQDAPSTRATAQKLVDAFNSAKSFYDGNSRYDVATNTSGSLFGEYDLRGRIRDLADQLSKNFSSQPSGFQSLAEVGVAFDTDGKMTIDATVFDAKLAENPSALTSLFAAAGNAAYAPIETLTRSVDGTMALKQSTLEDRIKILDESIARVDARLEQRRAFYEAKFLAMEKITAQSQSQGNALTQFINGLNGSSSK